MRNITVLAMILLGAGFLTGCETMKSRREWFVISRVDSGKVGRDVKLKEKYRIISSRVFVSTDKHIYNYLENDLKKMIRAGDGLCVFPEFEVMFPNVFTSAAAARPIMVNMEVIDPRPEKTEALCNEPNDGWYYNNVLANVSVCDAATGDIIGCERFCFQHGYTNSYFAAGYGVDGRMRWEPTSFEDCQTHRKDCTNSSFKNLYQSIYEGFSAAIVSALEKYENNGTRLPMQGNPPLYVKALAPDVQNYGGNNADNTAAAIGLFMGSMGAISSLNSGARTSMAVGSVNNINNQLRQANALSTQGQVRETGTATTSGRVCPVCMGSGRCRPCNGRGVIESVAKIAETSTSPLRSGLAQKNAGCSVCAGSGNCRSCGGTGRR